MEVENDEFFKDTWIKPLYVFLCFCIAFAVFKFQHLSLPYYWDEAWVYGKAARTMADNGLSLSPNSLHFELGRGHPLLFHFLVAAFLKIAGNNVFTSHLFCLLISISVLLAVFFISEKYIGKGAGIFTSLSIMVQPIFLAQSCLVLPEMTLTLFIILSLFFYTEKKRILFWLFAAAALLVKESAIVLYVSLSFVELTLYFWKKKQDLKRLLLDLCLVNSALIPWLVFLLIQKKQMGYFFFGEHTSYISFSPLNVFDKLERSLFFSFIAQGRNILLLTLLFSAIIALYQRKKKLVVKKEKNIFFPAAAWSFILMFILFTCVNYFSDRYLLCVIIVFTLIASFVILQTLRAPIAKWLALVAFVSAGVYNNLTYESNADYNLGYVNAVKVFKKSIEAMQKDLKKNDHIYAYFNMREALSNPYPGYLNEEKDLFRNIGTQLPGNFSYYIFSNVENEHDRKAIIEGKKIVLYRRFEEKQAWVEIWKQN